MKDASSGRARWVHWGSGREKVFALFTDHSRQVDQVENDIDRIDEAQVARFLNIANQRMDVNAGIEPAVW